MFSLVDHNYSKRLLTQCPTVRNLAQAANDFTVDHAVKKPVIVEGSVQTSSPSAATIPYGTPFAANSDETCVDSRLSTAKIEDEEPGYLCSACGKSLSDLHGLRRHIVSVHPKSRNSFKCYFCHLIFARYYLLQEHLRKEHECTVLRKLHSCFVCSEKFTKSDLFSHYTNEHGIELEMEDLTFRTFREFELWKYDTEKRTECYYKVEKGTVKMGGVSHHRYICHRSGYYQPKTKRQRALKAEGSKKLNGLCPSSIKVEELKDGSCIVSFLKTHVGHKSVSEHFSLPHTIQL